MLMPNKSQTCVCSERYSDFSTTDTLAAFCIEFICTDPLLPPGWYWVPMYPMADHVGPFATYEQALTNARYGDLGNA